MQTPSRLAATRRGAGLIAATVSAALLVGTNQAVARAPIVTEISIPGGGGVPSGIAVGSDHAIWFTELVANKVGRFASGRFTEFSLPGSGLPASLVAGPGGALWFADASNAMIWRLTTSGRLDAFPLPPCSGCAYSGGSGTGNVIVGPDGALWYSRPGNSAIGRISVTGAVHEFVLSTLSPGWITAGPDGAIWFTVSNGVARMTTNGVATLVYAGLNYPSAITTGPDGNLWFTGAYEDVVGRLTPRGGAKLFPLVTGCYANYIESGPRSLWVACYGTKLVYEVSTTGSRTPIRVPTSTAASIVIDSAGATWFTEPSAGRLGRIMP